MRGVEDYGFFLPPCCNDPSRRRGLKRLYALSSRRSRTQEELAKQGVNPVVDQRGHAANAVPLVPVPWVRWAGLLRNNIQCTVTGVDPCSPSNSFTALSIASCISTTRSFGHATRQTIVAEVALVPGKDCEM